MKTEIKIVSEVNLPNGFSSVHMPVISDYYFAVYHWENGYNGIRTKTWVASFNEDTKQARPTHGYFPPNPTGKKLKKYFKSIGFNYIY